MWCVRACLVRRMHTGAAVLTRTRTLACIFLLNSEDAARGGDAENARRRLRRAAIVVGLRRQGMRKTLKPAGDAQQPWPAAPRHFQILNKKLRTI